MKKLMIAMAAVAMACAANAEAIYTSAYIATYADKDTSPSTETGQACYSLYSMKLTDAESMSGVSGYSAISDWMGGNYAVNSDKVKNSSAATAADVFLYLDASQNTLASYYFKETTGDYFDNETECIGFCFFDDGTDVAYKVLGCNEIYCAFMDRYTGPWAQYNTTYSSGWIPVEEEGDVPEPTSAMLMLLGLAGLALKRKRA